MVIARRTTVKDLQHNMNGYAQSKMNQPKNLFLFLFFILNFKLYGQSDSSHVKGEVLSSDWKERGITIGVNFSKYLYGEIGHYRSYVYEVGGFPIESSSLNYGMEFSYFDKLIVAPKIQGRIHAYFFNTSLSSILYTDLVNNYSLKIRPEIGFGLWNFDINYGYNFGIIWNEIKNVNKHSIGIRYYLNIKKKYLHEYDKSGKTLE